MKQELEPIATFVEYVDHSIITKFPQGFFQKALSGGEEFRMQITETKIYLRRTNGRIITWVPLQMTRIREKTT